MSKHSSTGISQNKGLTRRPCRAVDFALINRVALPSLPAILTRLLPNGRCVGDEYLALNPHRPDRHLGSFRVNTRSGKWADFATEHRGGDVVSLVAFIIGSSQVEAARQLARMLGVEG